MNFYTDVLLLGDDILYRGYENGEHVQYRERVRPTLYYVSEDQTRTSKYKTLDGRYAHPQCFDGARKAREFIDKYKGVDNLQIHGYDRFAYQFIAKKFPNTCLLYTSPSPRDKRQSRMPSSA